MEKECLIKKYNTRFFLLSFVGVAFWPRSRFAAKLSRKTWHQPKFFLLTDQWAFDSISIVINFNLHEIWRNMTGMQSYVYTEILSLTVGELKIIFTSIFSVVCHFNFPFAHLTLEEDVDSSHIPIKMSDILYFWKPSLIRLYNYLK